MNESELNELAAEAIGEPIESVTPPEAKVKTFIRQSELSEDISFSQNNLDSAMMSQPSMFSRYSMVAAKAALQADTFKVALERIEATIDKELRDAAIADGVKTTESGITKSTKLDPRYAKAVQDYNEAKMVAAATKSTTEAFSQRRDMLIQIGKDQREDRLGELRISAGKERMSDLVSEAKSKVGRSSV